MQSSASLNSARKSSYEPAKVAMRARANPAKDAPADTTPGSSNPYCYAETEDVITSTMSELPGYRIVRTLGVVYGKVVQATGGGLKRVTGRTATSVIYCGHNGALSESVAETKSRGGNALMCIRFDSDYQHGIITHVLAYGTACVVEKVTPVGSTSTDWSEDMEHEWCRLGVGEKDDDGGDE